MLKFHINIIESVWVTGMSMTLKKRIHTALYLTRPDPFLIDSFQNVILEAREQKSLEKQLSILQYLNFAELSSILNLQGTRDSRNITKGSTDTCT